MQHLGRWPNQGGPLRPCRRHRGTGLLSKASACPFTAGSRYRPHLLEAQRQLVRGAHCSRNLVAGATENQAQAHQRVLETPFSSAPKVVLTVADAPPPPRAHLGPLGPPTPEGCRKRSAADVAPVFIVERGAKVLAADGEVVPLTPELQRATRHVADQSDMALGVRRIAASLAIELSLGPRLQ